MMTPSDAKEVAMLRDDADGLLAKAGEVGSITEIGQEARAVEFLAQVKRRAKIVDDKRKEYVAPLKAVIDNVNADFKSILLPLEEAERIVKAGMTAFRGSQDFRDAEKIRMDAEENARRSIAEASATLSPDSIEGAQAALVELNEAKADAPRTVESMSGQARFRKSWKFEVTCAGEVNRVLCRPDDKLIREAVKNGLRETPGIRIYEEVTPIIMS